MGHNFRHHFFENEIYLSLDDCINAFLLESNAAKEMEEKAMLLSTAQFFANLKRIVINRDKEEKEFPKKIKEEEKTWWGKLIWSKAKKNKWV